MVGRATNPSHFAVLTLALTVSTTGGFAQTSTSMPLARGDHFPELDVFDEAGMHFNAKSLKGQYAVIVSGCLT